jgi:membrane fusion protein (multidrug efflux system)
MIRVKPTTWWSSVLLLGMVALAACGARDEAGEREERVEGRDSTETEQAAVDSVGADSTAVEAVPVEADLVRVGPISSYLVFNSTIETEEAVQVFPQVSGLVERIAAEEGDRVEAGDTLLYIEDEQLRINYQEAKVNLEFQEGNFRRNEEMFKRKLLSDQDYETKRFEVEQARLRYDRARLELKHATVVAPFSGVITERYVQVGARVSSGSQLYDLIKLDDMIARVFVPGQYLMQVAKGQRAVIGSDFLPDQQFDGWVKRISPVVDPRSGTFKVTVGVSDRFEALRPGIFVSVRIVTDTHEEAVLVPKNAIVYDGGEQYVFAVRDSVAQRVLLQPGYESAVEIEALANVFAGDRVITVGQNGLKDGARVRLVGGEKSADMMGIDARTDSVTSVRD